MQSQAIFCRQEAGHFKQMMIGLNSRIGCAISKFTDENWSYQLLICLYGCNKKTNQKVYAVGKYAGEYCVCGIATPYKYLCSKDEPSMDCSLINDHNLESKNKINNRNIIEMMPRPTHRTQTMPPSYYEQFIRHFAKKQQMQETASSRNE